MKAAPMRTAQTFILASAVTACAVSASAGVVQGSIVGMPSSTVRAAVMRFCGSEAPARPTGARIDCIVAGRRVGFEFAAGEVPMLIVMSLDARTPEPDLRRYLDEVLTILSTP